MDILERLLWPAAAGRGRWGAPLWQGINQQRKCAYGQTLAAVEPAFADAGMCNMTAVIVSAKTTSMLPTVKKVEDVFPRYQWPERLHHEGVPLPRDRVA